MRSDWEQRALANPLYYVDATREEWTDKEFYARGRELVELVVDPAIAHLGIEPSGMRVLDIGCGAGRLAEGLAARFGEVWGLDISERMLGEARQRCPVKARWVLGDGTSLAGIPDESVDYAISYEVLQHVPHPSVAFSYVREVGRVLRPGGGFQLHLRSGSDSLRQQAVRSLPGPLRRLAGSVLEATGVVRIGGDIDTWLGCTISPASAIAEACDAGLDAESLPDPMHNEGMGYWLVGRKRT